ncbi:HlyD family secretion protein [Rhodopirellula bahusiensis]|uniref:Uncharacterized protein n=1 Tax=Rhodopirellula bahusiensis TaxID=2014065 RepID=A0A2G1W8L4_9BACT|nr:hypothetical protein [Rhodopirellula bahusiensis]PHQ35170.1 hypothetical protein CEE69_12225 [Rhodopirellula bahusiensis]
MTTTIRTNDIDQMKAKAQRDVEDANAVLEEARRRREATEQQVTGSQAELDRLNAEAAAKKQAIDAARQARIDADAELQKAAEQARIAEANLPQNRVTLETAEVTSSRVLSAFDEFRRESEFADNQDLPITESSKKFWCAIDNARDRLLTTDVDDDASAIVLGVEGIVLACERWEEDRKNLWETEIPPSELGDCPPENHRVEKFERDLRRLLAGESPTFTLPMIGDLILEGLSFRQIAQRLNYLRPSGVVCLETLAVLVDTFDRQDGPEFISVHWMGARTFETAWKRRQASIESRRKRRNLSIASSLRIMRDPNARLKNDPTRESSEAAPARRLGGSSASEPSQLSTMQADW